MDNYYEKKELYWAIFRGIWDNLRREGISRHSLEYIDNSDLFKYSPYKSLAKDQKKGLMAIILCLLNPDYKILIRCGHNIFYFAQSLLHCFA